MKADPVTGGEIFELDIRGQLCPSSLLIVLQEVNFLEQELKGAGKELQVLTDNHHSASTIPDAVTRMGYQIEIEEQSEGYRICISYTPRAQ